MDDVRSKVDSLMGELKHCRRVCREEKDRLRASKRNVEAAAEAQSAAQQVAESMQNEAHGRIADLVTSCLRSVFDDGSEFKIEFRRARGKTEARLTFVRDGHEESPLDASSGGKVDLASFALRLVSIMMSRPRRRKLLVLDEPFKHLSKNYAGLVRELMLKLSKDMGVQIIFSTHNPLLACGKIVEIGESNG